jgi:hypothetical protein
MASRLSRSGAVAFLAVLAAPGCTGDIGDGSSVMGPGPGKQEPTVTGPASPTPGNKDFEVRADAVTLLPFRVRLAKVATLAGVATTDDLLRPLRDAAGSLGDYDFANSRKPDSTWTALRISDWVRAVKPVCASSQMRSRYASLPEALPALIEAAHGRAADADDRAAVDSALAGLNLAEPARYEGICLAVLSSLEFLAQ